MHLSHGCETTILSWTTELSRRENLVRFDQKQILRYLFENKYVVDCRY
jgi:hypothetical protein